MFVLSEKYGLTEVLMKLNRNLYNGSFFFCGTPMNLMNADQAAKKIHKSS